MIDCMKVQTHLFILNVASIGAFLALFGPFRSYFWSWGQVQKFSLGPTFVNNQLWFWKYSPIFSFFFFDSATFWPLLHLFGSFGAIFQPSFGAILFRLRSVLEPTNVDCKFQFWRYSPIFLFLNRPNLGLFCTFWVIWGFFWGRVQVQKLFLDLSMQTINFGLEVQPFCS